MLPLQNFATGVLADLIRRQPASGERTTFVWTLAVGPAMAKVTTVELRNGLLIVKAKDARWAREVERARDTILPRVRLYLGQDAVRQVRVIADATYEGDTKNPKAL